MLKLFNDIYIAIKPGGFTSKKVKSDVKLSNKHMKMIVFDGCA